MTNDVARAFFEAPMRRSVCVEIPDEDKTQEDFDEDRVALLEMSLYGTRDAAANFQAEVKKFMIGQGFKVGKYNSSTFFHKRVNVGYWKKSPRTLRDAPPRSGTL